MDPLEGQAPGPPIKELTKSQRRVLGTLIEKGLTTPEYYPLTRKALTAGCNQKSNRDPVSNYSEDEVAEVVDQLRELGLAAVVHTESGRTERYRHYLRKRFTLSEPQVAILTELLLRGRQQLGELRTRASRMVAIDSQEQLRTELEGLIKLELAQANGSLDRRGIEVDHGLYQARENRNLDATTPDDRDDAPDEPPASRPAPKPAGNITASADGGRLEKLESALSELRQEHSELRDELRRLADQFDALRRDLGA